MTTEGASSCVATLANPLAFNSVKYSNDTLKLYENGVLSGELHVTLAPGASDTFKTPYEETIGGKTYYVAELDPPKAVTGTVGGKAAVNHDTVLGSLTQTLQSTSLQKTAALNANVDPLDLSTAHQIVHGSANLPTLGASFAPKENASDAKGTVGASTDHNANNGGIGLVDNHGSNLKDLLSGGGLDKHNHRRLAEQRSDGVSRRSSFKLPHPAKIALGSSSFWATSGGAAPKGYRLLFAFPRDARSKPWRVIPRHEIDRIDPSPIASLPRLAG